MNLWVAQKANSSMINGEVTLMTLIHGVCEMLGVLQSCIFSTLQIILAESKVEAYVRQGGRFHCSI